MMQNDLALSFRDLADSRAQLQTFCTTHYRSLSSFKSGISFKVNQSERGLGKGARHLSSTATCIESLLECPNTPKTTVKALARDFAVSAMSRRPAKWTSEGSAPIYCRCRALPLVVAHLPPGSQR